MDRYQIPEAALAAVERLHGVTLTFHDHTGLISRHLTISRDQHRHPRCAALKAKDQSLMCVRFEQRELAPLLDRHRAGIVQRCPAGLGEVVVPVATRDGAALGTLFAGPFAPAADVPLDRDARGNSPARLETLGHQAVADLREHLHQLGARLALWLDHREHVPTTRRARILQIIERRFRAELSVSDLASELGLSPGRAAHVVRSECGASFISLLTDARLQHAADLLRHSSLDVGTIALGSGYGDLSHFHRQFRRRFGVTPLAWRLRGGA
jgi:AraC-like DNA-binding protein